MTPTIQNALISIVTKLQQLEEEDRLSYTEYHEFLNLLSEIHPNA